MSLVGSTERTNDFGLIKKLGKAYEYGQRIYGDTYFGNEEKYQSPSEYGAKDYGAFFYGETKQLWGIYQRRHNNGRTIYAKLKFYTPTNPRTAPQTAQRNKFVTGMTAWGNLTDEQKKVYNERVKKKQLHGVNLFLREYLNSY